MPTFLGFPAAFLRLRPAMGFLQGGNFRPICYRFGNDVL